MVKSYDETFWRNKKWKYGYLKTQVVLTFGNQWFYLKFENASSLGNDSSGNNNDFMHQQQV